MTLKKNLIALSTASVVAFAGAGVASADEAVTAEDTQQQAVAVEETADVAEDVTDEVAEGTTESDNTAEITEDAVEEGVEEGTTDDQVVTDDQAEEAPAGSSSSSEETPEGDAGTTEDQTAEGSSSDDFFGWNDETTGLEKFADVAELVGIVGSVIAAIVSVFILF